MTHPNTPPNRSPGRRPAARFIAPTLLLLTLAGGCAGPNMAAEQPIEAGPLAVPSFKRDWASTLTLKDDEVDRLYVREGLLFVYTKTGTSFVLDRTNGTVTQMNVVPGGNYRLRAPVLLKDYIVYPTTSQFEIWDRRGQKVRTIDLKASIRSEAVGEQNAIYLNVDLPGGARIRKYDLVNNPTGRVSWELLAYRGVSISSAPAFNSGIVYAGDEDGRVYAVSSDARASVWPISNGIYGATFDARARVTADVQADDSGVYIPTLGTGVLYCIQRVSGQVKWQWFGTGPLDKTPVVTADSVYQPDPTLGIVALNKVDDQEIKQPQYNRSPRWNRDDLTQILAEDDKYTYALRKDGVILALDKKTGETQFTSRRKDFAAYATNTAKDGMIYAATRFGRVLGIKPVLQSGQVGELVWSAPPPGGIDETTLAMVPATAGER